MSNKVKVKDVDTPTMRDEKVFHNIALVAMILLSIYCIIPFVLMLSTSFSSESALAQYGYSFWPREFSFAAYDYLWAKRVTIGRCYAMTIYGHGGGHPGQPGADVPVCLSSEPAGLQSPQCVCLYPVLHCFV